jgi:hypothetical protein
MLQKLKEKQAECLEAAARCRARADAASDPTAKQEYLDLAEGWETLARSYDFNESLKDFIASRRQDDAQVCSDNGCQSKAAEMFAKEVNDHYEWWKRRPIERIRKLLIIAADPRSNKFEAITARRVAYNLLAMGISRNLIDIGDVLDLLPEELFNYAGPQ